MGKLDNSVITPDERSNVRKRDRNVENTVKESLVQLIIGGFNKVSAYDSVISEIVKQLSQRALQMDTNELLGFLAVLSKASSADSKTMLEMFRRSDSDLKRYISELQKIVGVDDNIVDATINQPKEDPVQIDLSPEKKEKVLRLLERMQNPEA
jgi:hypothetical protein